MQVILFVLLVSVLPTKMLIINYCCFVLNEDGLYSTDVSSYWWVLGTFKCYANSTSWKILDQCYCK